jgi:hypothetical protein
MYSSTYPYYYTKDHYTKYVITAQTFKCYLFIVQENLVQVTKPVTHIARVLGLNHGQDSGRKVLAILLSSSRSGVVNIFCAMDPMTVWWNLHTPS